jgi:hypothetical protein
MPQLSRTATFVAMQQGLGMTHGEATNGGARDLRLLEGVIANLLLDREQLAGLAA